MAALFQQLQHVLAAWDAVDSAEKPGVVERGRKCDGSQHKTLFMASLNAASDACATSSGGNVVGGHGGDPTVRAGEEEYPLWLAEMECDQNGGGDNNNNNHAVGDGGNSARPTALDTAHFTDTFVDPELSRRRITRLELARAALALFTSNSGIYRPILQKTLGFIFGLIDEFLEENADVSKRDAALQNALPHWSPKENEEVATAHERMRMMEVRMAKLVEEAATQRDHLKAEIVASQAREAKMEALLKHQIILSHSMWTTEDVTLLANNKQSDALYVKRLIARAENEKAIDELQKELAAMQQERDDLNRRVQELMELNGKYAHQCVELAARLSILTDHNIGMAISCEKYQNDVLAEKRRTEKHWQDLQIVRNVVMAAFMNRHHALQSWWASLHERRMENAEEALSRLLKASDILDSTSQDAENDKEKKKNTEETEKGVEVDEKDPLSRGGVEPVVDKSTNILSHLWIPRAGCNPETPEHLRSTSSVEYLRVNPLLVERIVHMILSQWRKDGGSEPLDIFTCKHLQKLCKVSEKGPFSSETSKRAIFSNCKYLPIVYALDAVSRSGLSGSLTYAFGLVSRRKVNRSLFYMLEFDSAVLLSVCRFLDTRRSFPEEPRGFIPIVQFASVLVAMYPSYPLLRLQQLLSAARNDAANRTESPMLIYYTVLLPERMLLDSVSITVDNAGALWDTGFVHFLYKFICDDVEDSLQTVEDSFYASASVRHCGVASESQLMFQAFDAMPDEDRHFWFPAIRTALSLWDELKATKASVVLEDMPRVSVHAAVKYLRSELLLRRGTRPAFPETHDDFLSGLQQDWNRCVGGHEKLNFDSYVGLIKTVDERRGAVWGPVSSSSFSEEGFREPFIPDDVTANTLLRKLLDKVVDV